MKLAENRSERSHAHGRRQWEQFFAKFDDSGLSFVYQEHTSDGEISRFNKFTKGNA